MIIDIAGATLAPRTAQTTAPHLSSSSIFTSSPPVPHRTDPPTAPTLTRYTTADVVDLLQPTASLPSVSLAILLVDLRAHTVWTQTRIKSSINICVPSTLLRRPAFGIERIVEGLSSKDKAVLSNWKNYANVIVVDNEISHSNSAEGLLASGGVRSLLSKFERELELHPGLFGGRLGWVKGGFGGLLKELTTGSAGTGSLLDHGPEMADEESDSDEGASSDSGLTGQLAPSEADTVVLPAGTSSAPPLTPTPTLPSLKHARPVLHVRDLPISAFQQASTSAFSHAGLESSPRNLEAAARPANVRRGSSKVELCKRRKGSPLGGLLLDMSYKHGAAASRMLTPGASPSPLRLDRSQVTDPAATPGDDAWTPPVAETRMASNPFFDNIRQNSEALSLSRSLSNLSPVHFAPVPPHAAARLPRFLSNLIKLDPAERAQILARQFYELELAERERLEGTLHWHATVQGNAEMEAKDDKVNAFAKYAISAGVELGSLNRFKNIFPYDHARVRLKAFPNGATDYINASHLHLATSAKHFIASQGPLRSTFADFWQLCDQEHVGVIIMLTNVIEGGREKCGTYWVTGQNEEWDVRVEGGNEHDSSGHEEEGGFFSIARTTSVESPADVERTIRRIVNVRRKADPVGTKPRKIRHIQYRDWPDFDIPANPADVVALVREVDRAQQEYLKEINWQGEEEPPCVAHCAGGVGRTGVFLMVSSMMEKLRQDRLARKRARAAQPKSIPRETSNARSHGNGDSMVWETDSIPPLTHHGSSSSSSTTASDSSVSPTSFTFNPTPSAPSLQPHSLSTASTPHHDHQHPIVPLPSRKLSDTTALTADMADSKLSEANSSSTIPAPSPTPQAPAPSPVHFALSTTSLLPALENEEPLFAAVNEIREQRMSMVANFRQYVCLYECTLIAALQELEVEEKEMREEIEGRKIVLG